MKSLLAVLLLFSSVQAFAYEYDGTDKSSEVVVAQPDSLSQENSRNLTASLIDENEENTASYLAVLRDCSAKADLAAIKPRTYDYVLTMKTCMGKRGWAY